jgi:hypothetical protein
MASKPIVKSPFSDAVGLDQIPQRGTGSGVYDHEPNLVSGMPDPSTHDLPEKYRDTQAPLKPVPAHREPGKNLKNFLSGE